MPKKPPTARDLIERHEGIREFEMGWTKQPGQEWKPTTGERKEDGVIIRPEERDRRAVHTHPSGSSMASLEDLIWLYGYSKKISAFHIAALDEKGKVTGYATYSIQGTFKKALGLLMRQTKYRMAFDYAGSPSEYKQDGFFGEMDKLGEVYRQQREIHDQLVNEGHLKVRFTPMPGYAHHGLRRRFYKKRLQMK